MSIQAYDCILCSMGWDVDRILDFYCQGGYHVWEFHPAEGKIWLEPVHLKTRVSVTTLPFFGVLG